MKIRHGFVSNSSSSSFVLNVDSDTDEIVIRIPLDKLSDVISGDETGVDSVVRTKEDLDRHFLYQYGCRDQTIENLLDEENYYKEEYDKGLQMINAGKIVIYGSVSYHDQGLQNFLEKIGATLSN